MSVKRTAGRVNGIILAGGRSSRMGRDKALLTIEGKPLLLRLAEGLAPHVGRLVIAAGTEERARAYRELLRAQAEPIMAGALFVTDSWPDRGPLAGLHAGLSVLPEGYAFVVACDVPNISFPLLERLIAGAGSGADVIHVPEQPFHALYHTRVADRALAALRANELRAMALLRSLETLELKLEEKSDGKLHNLNTPDDYRAYTSGGTL